MSNLSADVKINHWPEVSKWSEFVERSLKWFVDEGALISWCGTELCSPALDVISSGSGGNVYAAYSEKTGLMIGLGLEDEYKELGGEELDTLNEIINNRN